MDLAAAGVWRNELAGALIYGLGILAADLCFTLWRARVARLVPRARLGGFLGFSFVTRLFYILAALAVSLKLFGRTGRLVICLSLLLLIPSGIMAARFVKPR